MSKTTSAGNEQWRNESFHSGREHAETSRPRDKAGLKEGYYHAKSYDKGYKEHEQSHWGKGK